MFNSTLSSATLLLVFSVYCECCVPAGVSARSFHQCFHLCSSVFNLQTATPGVRKHTLWHLQTSVYSSHTTHSVLDLLFVIVSQGKPIEFTGVDDSTARWVQEFSVKPYANPAKLESIDGLKSLCSLESECIRALLTSGYVWCFRCPLSGAADSRLSRSPKRSRPQRIPRTNPVPLHFSSKWGSLLLKQLWV